MKKEMNKVRDDPEFPVAPFFNPTFETINEYKIRNNEFINKVKQLFIKHGWKKSTKKRDTGAGIETAYEWLVQYQILKLNYSEISSDYYVTQNIDTSDNSVMKAIKKTAKSIGLRLR